MRELTVDLFSTLDGYGGGGPQSAPYWGYDGPELQDWVAAQLAVEHVTLMGATTYRAMAEIVEVGDNPSFTRMAELPKIVFSRTLSPPLTWANTTLVSESIETAVPALKALDDGLPMRTIGSISLVRSLFELNLVDRLRLMVFPTLHGASGEEPLFKDLPDVTLNLADTTVLDGRLVLLDYRVGERLTD
jgi:dihydrofolate reductase